MPIAERYRKGGSHYKEYAAYQRKWNTENRTGSFEKKLKRLLILAKSRAKEKGIEFCITEADFLVVSHCPLLNTLLVFSKRGKGVHPNSATIDRIDPTKGYVPGNVWVISARANRIKSDASLEELETLLSNLRNRVGL